MTRISLAGGRIDEKSEAESAHRICQEPHRLWEKLWQWGGERLNPILIKEVRQSLKSRQFEVSFGLTLVIAVGWTLLYVSLSVPRIFYIPTGGAELLVGYTIILLVPLLITIPFSAFRSLTTEIEESTFELLSITSLSARQIVKGKMGTAIVQIVLFVSALSPCIVLTYMLRGVSLFTIGILLGVTVAYSIMLVSLALMLATVSKTRAGQSGLSILLLAVLVISFLSCMSFLTAVPVSYIFSNLFPRDVSITLFALVTILIALVSLMVQSAAAAIEFASENKSTPIRIRLMIVVGLMLFWFAMAMVGWRDLIRNEAGNICLVLLIMFYFVWLAIGSMVCGERGLISPRARRTLPATHFGRVFLTWLGRVRVWVTCTWSRSTQG